MCQQFYVIRNNPAPGTPAAKAKQERDAHKRERKGLPDPTTTLEPAPEAEVVPDPARRQQPKKQTRSQRRKQTPPGTRPTAAGGSRPQDGVRRGRRRRAVRAEQRLTPGTP